MLKDKFAVLSIISLWLYAIVTFCEKALETAFHVRLIAAKVSFSSSDWQISVEPIRWLLLLVAIVCLVIAVIYPVMESRKKQK